MNEIGDTSNLVSKNMDEDAFRAGIEALSPLDGTFPFFMPNSGAEKYELKNGSGITDFIQKKKFNRETILNEIKTYGFMCPFEPCKKLLMQSSLEEFMVVCDSTCKYGETFLLLYSSKSIQNFTSASDAMKHQQEQREKEKMNAQEKAEVDPSTLKKRTMTESHIISKKYFSSSMEETATEISNLSSVSSFYAGESLYHVATQAVPISATSIMQTDWNHKVDNSIQYQPRTFDQKLQYYEKLPAIIEFLRRAIPLVETALQENETVDIFCDILDIHESNDSVHTGPAKKNQMKELRNFTDLELSKGKSITCIDWHPTNSEVLATASCKNLSFDEILTASSCHQAGYIMMWDTAKWLHPALVLQCPVECPCFRFNPTVPNIIVGGGISGQIAMWDVSEKNVEAQKVYSYRDLSCESEKFGDVERKENRLMLKPCALSYPGYDHRRYVADLVWLPPESHINAKGKLLSKEHWPTHSFQFITISGDGYVMIWDIRYQEILEGKLPHIAKPKTAPQQSSPSKVKDIDLGSQVSYNWLPLFRIKIKGLESAGEVSLCQMNYYPNKIDSKTSFICSSEEGYLLSICYCPYSDRNMSSLEKENNTLQDDPEYTKWVVQDHKRPCRVLIRSPFFPNIIVSVSDWSFHMWNVETRPEHPFFVSPRSTSMLTGGRWSPTRPGILLISKSDGYIDIWDFTDSSYGASTSILATPNSITSLEFYSTKDTDLTDSGINKHHLAVGDSLGSLHVFEISRNLSTPLPKEDEIISCFFMNEMKRFDVVQKINIKRTKNQDKTPNLFKDKENVTKDDNVEYLKEIDESLLAEQEKQYKEFELECLRSLNIEPGSL